MKRGMRAFGASVFTLALVSAAGTSVASAAPGIAVSALSSLKAEGYVTVRVLQRFGEVQSLEGGEVARHNVTLTSHNGNGVRVRLRAA